MNQAQIEKSATGRKLSTLFTSHEISDNPNLDLVRSLAQRVRFKNTRENCQEVILKKYFLRFFIQFINYQEKCNLRNLQDIAKNTRCAEKHLNLNKLTNVRKYLIKSKISIDCINVI